MSVPNTNSHGGQFSPFEIRAVWNKAQIVPGVDPAVRRKDVCGAWIDWSQYGVTVAAGTGWEIDHIVPKARNGSDQLPNLQPLQWQNNRAKGDSLLAPPASYCAVRAA